MCEEDGVWVLVGANTPVVLRELENGRHQFLGEAYVHGIMHGEATDLVSELTNIMLEYGRHDAKRTQDCNCTCYESG